MRFKPTEVLFAPTSRCNLDCRHCENEKSSDTLSSRAAREFLDGCRKIGVTRVGFTGGEPFMALDFMRSVSRYAAGLSFLFSRIMTNGVWYGNVNELRGSLEGLSRAGYDGSICVSVDAFHRQKAGKIARFIRTARDVWKRPDCVSVACVIGAMDKMTKQKLKTLSIRLSSRLSGFDGQNPYIRGKGQFIKILKINLSSIGPAGRLKNPWDGRWFTEDHCEGPGNVFFVGPAGDVRPCCGYAAGSDRMLIGNIYNESAAAILEKARRNRFASGVFGAGLTKMRKKLEHLGFRFPGKTSDHCYFCNYVMTKVPGKLLDRCLDAVKVMILAISTILTTVSFSFAENYPQTAGGLRTLKIAKDCRPVAVSLIRRIPIPKWYHEGLFYDGESIWVTNGENGKTWVIDPVSGQVKREIVPATGFTEAITRDSAGTFFLTDWNEKKIYGVGIRNNRMEPESFVSLAPARPTGIVWNGEGFFVITWTRSLFGTKFDIIEMDGKLNTTGRIAIRKIQEPAHLAWDGRYLWVTSWFSKTVYKVDPGKWEITGYFKSPVSRTTGIAWDGRYLWLTGTRGDLFQLEVLK